jgi:hypothetical protein
MTPSIAPQHAPLRLAYRDERKIPRLPGTGDETLEGADDLQRVRARQQWLDPQKIGT